MKYENMRMAELKSLARDNGLRNYSQMRKTELVALLQNNGTFGLQLQPPPLQRHAAYVTLKLDDNGCCRIHSMKHSEASISDRDKEIVTSERYVVMPWKMVTRHGKNMTLAEAVDEIFSHHESEAKELKRREIEREEIEKKLKEYYEAHMKAETERLNKWVNWYEVIRMK